eukprot:766549-Hanusia_phi.AAC.1
MLKGSTPSASYLVRIHAPRLKCCLSPRGVSALPPSMSLGVFGRVVLAPCRVITWICTSLVVAADMPTTHTRAWSK